MHMRSRLDLGLKTAVTAASIPHIPPLRLPSRSASGTLGLRAARQGARGGGGLARAPSRSLVPTGRCGRGPLMPRHRDGAGGSAGGSRGRGARRRGPAAAASDDNAAAMEDDAPPQVPVQILCLDLILFVAFVCKCSLSMILWYGITFFDLLLSYIPGTCLLNI